MMIDIPTYEDVHLDVGVGTLISGRASDRRLTILLGTICVAFSVGSSALFLGHQSLWLDEATQMSGLSLGPIEQVRWLSGQAKYPFGVSDDRMPPLSYWAGWAWSSTFGLRETPMRWMGVAAVGLASLLIFLAAHRAWGPLPGLAAGMLFGLSPNVIVQAVEIRAYPLFLLASAASYYCLTRLLAEPVKERPVWLFWLAVFGLIATYTHYFGLVLAGATMFASMVLVPRKGGRLWPILLASFLVGLFSLGLFPFVRASVGISESVGLTASARATELVRLSYRLLAHPATSVSRIAVGLALMGGIVAGVVALTTKRRGSTPSLGLLIALAAGGTVVAIAQLAQSKFDAANPSYNVWMLPALSMFLASGMASASRKGRIASCLGVSMLLASHVYGTVQLAIHGDAFAHQAHRPIESLIVQYQPERVALIHDVTSGPIWGTYTPVRYQFGGAVRQFALVEQPQNPLCVADYPGLEHKTDPRSLSAEYLIVVRPVTRGANEIAHQIHEGILPLGDGPVARALKLDDRWKLISETSHLAFVQADIDVFRRTRPPDPD
jgi:hypothetical protein